MIITLTFQYEENAIVKNSMFYRSKKPLIFFMIEFHQ